MFNLVAGITIFRVNEPVIVSNDSDFGFRFYEFSKIDGSNVSLLTDSIIPGQTFNYKYEYPGKNVLSLRAVKTDNASFTYTSQKSVTFDVGYVPSVKLTYQKRPDQNTNYSSNFVVKGQTFEFIRENPGLQDSYHKIYTWDYNGGITGSTVGDGTQKVKFNSTGNFTIGVTVQNIFGTTASTISFSCIDTPIIGITSTVPFGSINDNTSMTLSAYMVMSNQHTFNDVNLNWTIFGSTYQGITISNIIARYGMPSYNITLDYSSKFLAGLSGTTSQGYEVNQAFNPVTNIPVYADFSKLIQFGDSEYGTNLGYSSASEYQTRLSSTNCVDCKWIAGRTYGDAINQFNSLSPEKKKCINVNIEIPWSYILLAKFNNDAVNQRFYPAVRSEWERMYGSLNGIEPITGLNYYNANDLALKNTAVRLWQDIVTYMKNNGAERVIHYVYPPENIADGYYGSQLGIPISGYRETIFPKGICHSYWYKEDKNDAFFTYSVNPFLATLVFGNYSLVSAANSNASSYGLGAYNYFPNLPNPGITKWKLTYNYDNFRKKPDGSGETYNFELEDLKYWTKVSHGNLVQGARDILYQYGVTYANISPVVWPTMFASYRNLAFTRSLNHWNEDSQGITLMADIIVDGFFGNRDIDSMELFDPYSRPNSITIWTESSYYKAQYVGLNINCLDFNCTNCPAGSSGDIKITRSVIEKLLFERPQVGISGISGTIQDEPIGINNQNQHKEWYDNNNLGNTFWAGSNWVENPACNATLNQTVWWTPSDGSLLPPPCTINQSSVLAPWLNFNNSITTQDIRRAIRHWVTDQNITFIESLRQKLNTVKPNKIIPMYGDWKLFVGWNSTELSDENVQALVKPYKTRLQKILIPNSYIGVITFGDFQTKLNLLSAEERKNILLDIKFPWVAIAYDTVDGSTAPHMSGAYYDRVRQEWIRQNGNDSGIAGATIGDLKQLTQRLFSDCIEWGLTNGCVNIAAYQRAVGLNGLSGYGTEEKGAGIPFAGIRGNTYSPSSISQYVGSNPNYSVGYTSEYSYWKARTNATDENMTIPEYVNLELSQGRYDVFVKGLSAAGRWMIPMYNFYPNTGSSEAVQQWKTMYPVDRISPDGITQEYPFDIDDLNYWTEKNFAKVVTEFRRGLISAGATTGIPKVAVLMNLAGSGFDLSANGHDAVNPVPKTFMKLNHWAFMKDLEKAAELEIRGLFSHRDINFPYFTYPDEVWFWDFVSYYCVTLPSLNFEALNLTTQYNTALQCAVARNAIEKKLFNRPYPQKDEPIGYTFDEYFEGILGITLHDNWFFNNNLGTSFWRIPSGSSGIVWWDPVNGSRLPSPCSIDPETGPLAQWLPQGTTLTTTDVHLALKHYLSDSYCSALEKAKQTIDQLFGNV